MSLNVPYSVASNAKEFLAGMVAEQASYHKTKEKAAKDIDTFVKNIDSDLRSIYDKYIPNVHVVSALSFTNILANRLTQSPEKFFTEDADNTATLLKFGNPNSREYRRLYKVILDSLKSYHSELLAQQNGIKNPVLELNNISSSLFNRTRKLSNSVSARVLGAEFSSRIRTVFGNKAVLAAIDPRLGSSKRSFVFFSSSFNSITASMREKVYKNVQKYLQDVLKDSLRKDFTLGSAVNTGHAAVVSDLDNFINTPAFAQVIYGVSSGRSKRMSSSQVQEAAELFKTESKLLDNKITVNKEFTSTSSGYGVLLSLGVTFTIIEDAELNSSRGSKFEKTSVAKFNISKPQSLSRSTIIGIQKTLMRLVYRNNPALAKSSRNMVDFISDAVLGELTGKRTKSEKTKLNVRNSKNINVVSVNTKAKPRKFTNSLPDQQDIRLNSVDSYSILNLTALQNLINANLAEKIKENMGDGNARNVLNLRSGRLAESAQVERMSQSRAGMITAFYSYMKNPYATFSAGGRQQDPKSRDPKLLIAKSIREIAAQQVGNRLRSVLV